MNRRFQFSLRTALVLVFVLALIAWPTTAWLRTYLANRGLVPVKGRVTFKGQPLLAKIVLTPKAGGITSQGVTKADGTYDLERLLRPGEYTVGITEVGTAKRGLSPKFGDASMSGLTITAIAGGQNIFDFDLSD